MKIYEFSKNLECSTNELSKIEECEEMPTLEIVNRLCEVFKINRFSLICGPFCLQSPLKTTGDIIKDYEVAAKQFYDNEKYSKKKTNNEIEKEMNKNNTDFKENLGATNEVLILRAKIEQCEKDLKDFHREYSLRIESVLKQCESHLKKVNS
jgi:transcriptional regulator with XRE-family HTH domain